MALLLTHFYSQALGMASSMDVILPEPQQGIGITQGEEESDAPLPVLYLLHGLSDDHSIWQRRTSIERYVAGKPLCVVMPNVHRSFYTNEKHGMAYWTFISEELPALVKKLFKVSSRREDTFVAGLSMGGYGALKLGLLKPETYSHVASLSGATCLKHDYENDVLPDMQRIFGSYDEYLASDGHLPGVLERRYQGKDALKPRVFQCCGTADFLYEDNLAFRDQLLACGFDLTYSEEEEAVHEWGYWDRTIQDVLAWLPL